MPSYTYYDQLSVKTKLLNIFRKLFTIPPFENLLVKITNEQPITSFWGKLIPPEYLYAPGSLRIIERNGIKFELDLSSYVDLIYYYNTKDTSLDLLFATLKKDFVIIDIGANVGHFALQFAQHVPIGRVIAFEPDAGNLNKLNKNLALNNFKNIQISSNGLGDKADSVKLYKVCESNSGMNRILKATNTEFPYHEINIVKLDDEVNNYKLTRVDLIKIDVEGYELNVLKGALLTIQKYKPILFIELDDNNLKEQGTSAFELINFIKSLGYQIRQAESNQLLVETDTYTDCHYDILCQYI